MHDWIKKFPGAVTVCDTNGIIVEMNEKACTTFIKPGEPSLVGKSLFDCHKPESINKIKHILETKEPNAYTIEKNGQKKLIYQAPWYQENGEPGGLVELSLIIPFEMPHFKRG